MLQNFGSGKDVEKSEWMSREWKKQNQKKKKSY